MRILVCFVLIPFLLPPLAYGEELFDHSLQKNPEKQRSLFWAPLGSFFLPSLDQWWERQYSAAGVYTGMTVAGYSLLFSTLETNNDSDESEGPEIGGPEDLDKWGDRERNYVLGNQLVQVAGSLSAYQSFRTAARTHGSAYSFLPEKEDTGDILLAPFRFKFLKRPTTYIPLSLLALAIGTGIDNRGSLNIDDSALVMTMSYGAGTGEEALFRGWMMPLFYEKMGSRFWSNATSATIFGAAHYSESNPLPIAQTLIGYYLGWVTQRNKWSLQESVFIHTWWDVLVFAGIFLDGSTSEKEAYYRLPPLHFSF